MVQNPGWHALRSGSSFRPGILELLGRQSSCKQWPKTKATSVHPALPFFSLWVWEFPALLESSRGQRQKPLGTWWVLQRGRLMKPATWALNGIRRCGRAWVGCGLCIWGRSACRRQQEIKQALGKKRNPLPSQGDVWGLLILRCLFPLFPSRHEQSRCPWISKACKYQHPNWRYVWGLGNVDLASGPADSDSNGLARALQLTSLVRFWRGSLGWNRESSGWWHKKSWSPFPDLCNSVAVEVRLGSWY